MKKLKLLGVLPSYSSGGAEKITLKYFRNIDQRPFFLKLFVIDKTGPLKNNKVDALNFSYKRFLYAIPNLIFYVRKNKVNVIFSTFPHITIILLLTKILKLHNSSIVVRQPNMLVASLTKSLKLRLIKFLYMELINYADIILVTSQAMMQEAIGNGFNKKKLFLISNPVNIRDIRKGIIPKRTKGLGIKLVFVGRLTYQKGLDRVIKLLCKIENIELLVIGEGELKKNLKKICKENLVDKKVTFLGFLSNPYNFVAGSDYFLLPSRWEGMPNCVLESLALGTPVISFKEIEPLNDLKENISNKSIILEKNENSLLKLLKNLKPRKDYLKPNLRKNLLLNSLNDYEYTKKVDKIILNAVCKKK